MISKINSYMGNIINPQETLFVKLINNCTFFIYMALSYTVNDKKISKQTPVFKRKKSELLTFPSNALHLEFKVFNCKCNPPQLLYTRSIRNDSSSCYKIMGPSTGHIICIEIPC